ncbi:MAG: 1-acyl-sn-glycerol-3-phosphate acyltransferase, partial [Hyphomonadaceae bacterium]|nr:1-acyl-sn-glycerol-3-phosphate acyltransferase [Hyphomonadaceae bacterium]
MTRHTAIAPSTARPTPSKGLFSNFVRACCIVYLKLTGWRMQGDWPAIDKMVLVAAPHTSNWDGLQMLVAAGYYRIRLRWMGKKSLTTGPFGWIIKALGCVPIDRSQSNDVVKIMADAIGAADSMVLAIPPEGTRARVNEWKSGFYHIAVAANVPIVLSVLDYKRKTMS